MHNVCCNRTHLKDRRIVLHKDEIFKAIDELTMKLTEVAMAEQPVETRDAVASDMEETLDSSIISGFADARDARVRVKIAFALRPECIEEVDNTQRLEPDFIYNLALPVEYPDHQLKAAAGLLHEYFVKGVLYDWYRHIGSAFGNHLAAEVEELEARLSSTFRQAGFVKRVGGPYLTNYR